MKNFTYLILGLLLVVGCSEPPKITTQNISFKQGDSIQIKFDKDFDTTKYSIVSGNFWVASIVKENFVKALYPGDTKLYLINKQDSMRLDSIKVQTIQNFGIFELPNLDFSLTEDEISKWENAKGFKLLREDHDNGSHNFLFSRYMLVQEGAVQYQFNNETKALERVLLVIPPMVAGKALSTEFSTKLGMLCGFLDSETWRYLVYDGSDEKSFSEKFNLMTRGAIGSKQLRDCIVFTVRMRDFQGGLGIFTKAKDTQLTLNQNPQ